MSGYRLRKCVPEKGVAVVRLSKLELWVRGAAALFFSLAFLVTFLPQGALGFTIIGIDVWTRSVSFAFCAVGFLAFMRALFWRIRVYGNRKYFDYTTFLGRRYRIGYSDITRFKRGRNYTVVDAGRRYYIDVCAENYGKFSAMLDKHRVAGNDRRRRPGRSR